MTEKCVWTLERLKVCNQIKELGLFNYTEKVVQYPTISYNMCDILQYVWTWPSEIN